jgi:membrane carboxypeptidase/penicillin-binding protein PbpC
VAYLITDILSDDLARVSTFGEGSALRLSRPAAAKTGTTTDWRDNWTMGYTPDLVVGVWTGNADNEPMRHVSGVTGAAPIWHDVMEALLKGQPVRQFVEPPGMVHVEVCTDSGQRPSPLNNPASVVGIPQAEGATEHTAVRQPTRCPRTITELFIEGTEPTQVDDWHWLFTLDTRNGLLAGPDCPAEFTRRMLYTLYPAEAQDWAREQSIPQPPDTYSPLCPGTQTADGGQSAGEKPASDSPRPLYSLTVTNPNHGAHYRLSSEVPESVQQILIAVRPGDGVSPRQVTLLVDGRPLVTLTQPPYQAMWPMKAGTHVIAAIGEDIEGNEIAGNRVIIEVVE